MKSCTQDHLPRDHVQVVQLLMYSTPVIVVSVEQLQLDAQLDAPRVCHQIARTRLKHMPVDLWCCHCNRQDDTGTYHCILVRG